MSPPETPTTPATTSTFSDVPTNHPFYTSIGYFARKNIIRGYADGTFKSTQNVTRSELLGIVLSALDIAPHGEIVTGIFHDVPKEHWVNPLISEAIKRKIISTDRKEFEPNSAVSRVEFLAILGLASGENIPTDLLKSWKDISWNHWSHKYAQFALKYNLLDNISGDTFRPNDPITRGEIAEAVYRYLVIKNRLK